MFAALTFNSLRLLLRQKLAWPLLLPLVALVPLASAVMFTADGTLTGVLKMMWSWQFYTTSIIMMLLTVYMAIVVLDSELRDLQIINTAVKPVARWQLLLSKFAAICVLAALGIGVAGASSYAALRWRMRTPAVCDIRATSPENVNFSGADAAQKRLQDAAAQQELARRYFFTSRRACYPVLPDLFKDLQNALENLKKQNVPSEKLPSQQELNNVAADIIRQQAFPVPFSAGREFTFTNLPVGSEELLFRFKISGTHREEALGWLKAGWNFVNPQRPPFSKMVSFRRNTEQEFPVPGNMVTPDGKLTVVLYNTSVPVGKSPAAELSVPFKGLWIMVPQGTFTENFCKAWALLWIRLCLLAALGVGCGAIIGAPINTFLMLAVLLIGSLNFWVRDLYAPKDFPRPAAKQTFEWAQWAKKQSASLLMLLPDFSETDPVDNLNSATEISWGWLARQAACDILIRGGIILLVGVYVFKNKELAIYHH